MQVLLRKSESDSNARVDIQCSVCHQGFRVYWERTSDAERDAVRATILAELAQQHVGDNTAAAHPGTPFNVPQWTGSPQFSGAALLGGLSGFHRVAGPELDLNKRTV